MKRFFCLFAVIIMLAVSLLGCSQGEMNDNGNSNADSQSNINEPAEETAESRGPEDDNEKQTKKYLTNGYQRNCLECLRKQRSIFFMRIYIRMILCTIYTWNFMMRCSKTSEDITIPTVDGLKDLTYWKVPDFYYSRIWRGA